MEQKKIKILVVDDARMIRDCVKYYFKTKGFIVLSAGSAEEALPIIIGHRPEIMLVDRELPGISGADLLRLVREINTTIKVIMLSDSDYQIDSHLSELQVRDFINKPIHVAELDAAVRRILDEQGTASNQ
ncbi:MAG: response regulator transcription factor [Deltaproteobacteria bacterium]